MQCCFTFILFSEKIEVLFSTIAHFDNNLHQWYCLLQKAWQASSLVDLQKYSISLLLMVNGKSFLFIILECLMAQTLKSISQEN